MPRCTPPASTRRGGATNAPRTMMIGGSTEAAARRAARLRLPMSPAIGDPKLPEIYGDECAKVGSDQGFITLPAGPGFVHVAEDPEAAWAKIGPHALHEANVYESWQTPGQRSAVDVHAKNVDDVRKSGVYRVVAPDPCGRPRSQPRD